MAESTVVKNMRDGILEIVAGGSTYEVAYEEGNLALDIPGPTVENYLDRGRIADTNGGQPSLRYGDDQPITGTFVARLRDLHSDTDVTLADFVTKSGAAIALGSTMGATSEMQTVDFYWTVRGVPHGEADRRVYLPWVHITGSLEEGNPSTISISFTSYCVYPIFS